MFAQWKKLLLLVILAGVLYGGCNSQSILKVENVFRKENPNFNMTPRICYFLGNISYMTFRYQLALDIIERNLQDFPYNSGAQNARYRQAVCYEKLGKYDRAIQLYEDFLLDYPKTKRYDQVSNKVAKLKALYQQL